MNIDTVVSTFDLNVRGDGGKRIVVDTPKDVKAHPRESAGRRVTTDPLAFAITRMSA